MNEWLAIDIPYFLLPDSLYVKSIVWFILSVCVLQNIVYAIQIPTAWLSLRRYTRASDVEQSWQLLMSDATMPVAIIVPAYNEEHVIVDSVSCLLSLQYPEFDVIVVNDGSTDRTLNVLIEAFDLSRSNRFSDDMLEHAPIRSIYKSSRFSNLIVVDKDNAGSKADAINAGINVSRMPLFCVVDSDSLLEGSALLRAVRPFVEDPKHVIAVGGTIRVVNGCEVKNGHIVQRALPQEILPLFQTLEYTRAFLMARTALSSWKILLLISGAFGVFRRDPVIEVGGYSKGTVGEDMEIIIKLHRYMCEKKRPYAVRYVAEPVCWTQAPEDLKTLARQRTRWQRGALECFFKHIRMLFNPRYGRIGMIAFPLNFLMDVLGPFVEVLGYFLMTFFYLIGAISLPYFLAFTGLVVFYGIFISLSSLLLEEKELWRCPRLRDLLLLCAVAVVENFGYRQINNVWRVIGSIQFLFGKKGWGSMQRKKFAAKN